MKDDIKSDIKYYPGWLAALIKAAPKPIARVIDGFGFMLGYHTITRTTMAHGSVAMLFTNLGSGSDKDYWTATLTLPSDFKDPRGRAPEDVEPVAFCRALVNIMANDDGFMGKCVTWIDNVSTLRDRLKGRVDNIDAIFPPMPKIIFPTAFDFRATEVKALNPLAPVPTDVGGDDLPEPNGKGPWGRMQ